MAESSRYVLDVPALHAAIVTVARHREMPMTAVAAETGVGQSTLTRMGQGRAPDADGLLSLMAWLHADARDFARLRTPIDPAVAATRLAVTAGQGGSDG